MTYQEILNALRKSPRDWGCIGGYISRLHETSWGEVRRETPLEYLARIEEEARDENPLLRPAWSQIGLSMPEWCALNDACRGEYPLLQLWRNEILCECGLGECCK